jgi:hypothetical protein
MSFRLNKYKDAISRPKPCSSFDMPYILLFPNYSGKMFMVIHDSGPSKYFLFYIPVVLIGVDHRSLR